LVETSPGVFLCPDCMLDCPVCGRPMVLGAKLCSQCKGLVDGALVRANDLMKAGDLKHALREMDALLERMPGEPRAVEAKRAISAILLKVRPLSEAAKAAYSQRQFVRFLALYAEIRRLGEAKADWAAHIARAKRLILQAKRAVRKAAAEFQTDPRQAARTLGEALEMCADLPEVKAALAGTRNKIRELEAQEAPEPSGKLANPSADVTTTADEAPDA